MNTETGLKLEEALNALYEKLSEPLTEFALSLPDNFEDFAISKESYNQLIQSRDKLNQVYRQESAKLQELRTV